MKLRDKTKKSLIDYLDQTTEDHNGFTFNTFSHMVESGLNDVNIAKAFGADRRTVKKWRKIYEEE